MSGKQNLLNVEKVTATAFSTSPSVRPQPFIDMQVTTSQQDAIYKFRKSESGVSSVRTGGKRKDRFHSFSCCRPTVSTSSFCHKKYVHLQQMGTGEQIIIASPITVKWQISRDVVHLNRISPPAADNPP